MPYDASSSSRFVRAFYLKQIALLNHKLKNSDDCISFASGLLSTMTVIKGVTGPGVYVNNKIIVEYTQFYIMKDVNRKLFYYRTYDNLNWELIDLNKINWSLINTVISFDDINKGIKDVSDKFNKFNPKIR